MFSQAKPQDSYNRSYWKIIVEGIANNISQSDIISYFQSYTQLVECTIMSDQSSRGTRGGFGFVSGVNDEAKRSILQAETHILKGERIQCTEEGRYNVTVVVRDVMYQSENKILIIDQVSLRSTIMDINNLFDGYGKIDQMLFVKDGDSNCCHIMFEEEDTVDLIVNRNLKLALGGDAVLCRRNVIQGTLGDLYKELYDKDVKEHGHIIPRDNTLQLKEIREEDNTINIYNTDTNTSTIPHTTFSVPKKKKLLISQIFEPNVLSLQIKECLSKKLNYHYLRKQLEESAASNGDDKSYIMSLLQYVDDLKTNPITLSMNNNSKTQTQFIKTNVSDYTNTNTDNNNSSNKYNLNSKKMNQIDEIYSNSITRHSLEKNSLHFPSMQNSHMINNLKQIYSTEDKLYPKMNSYFKYKLFDSYGENIKKVSIITNESIVNSNNKATTIINSHLHHPYHGNNGEGNELSNQYQQEQQTQLQQNYLINFPYDNMPFNDYQKEQYCFYQSKMFKPKKRLMKTYCPY